MTIRMQQAERSQICGRLLAKLPRWFARPEANAMYVLRTDHLPMFVDWEENMAVGFVSLFDHNDSSTEIFVMAVDPDRHRRGVGRRLLAAAERYVRQRGGATLFVRTLGATHPDQAYQGTRDFYRAMGFLPVEELPDHWGPGTPSLLMIKLVGNGGRI